MNIARSPKTWIARILAAGAAVAASVVLATSSAHAYIPPRRPGTQAPRASYSRPMYCGGGRIDIGVLASVQPGYTAGQYATYRYVAYSGDRMFTSSLGRPTRTCLTPRPVWVPRRPMPEAWGTSHVDMTPGTPSRWPSRLPGTPPPAGRFPRSGRLPTGSGSGYNGPALPFTGTRECRS